MKNLTQGQFLFFKNQEVKKENLVQIENIIGITDGNVRFDYKYVNDVERKIRHAYVNLTELLDVNDTDFYDTLENPKTKSEDIVSDVSELEQIFPINNPKFKKDDLCYIKTSLEIVQICKDPEGLPVRKEYMYLCEHVEKRKRISDTHIEMVITSVKETDLIHIADYNFKIKRILEEKQQKHTETENTQFPKIINSGYYPTGIENNTAILNQVKTLVNNGLDVDKIILIGPANKFFQLSSIKDNEDFKIQIAPLDYVLSNPDTCFSNEFTIKVSNFIESKSYSFKSIEDLVGKLNFNATQYYKENKKEKVIFISLYPGINGLYNHVSAQMEGFSKHENITIMFVPINDIKF